MINQRALYRHGRKPIECNRYYCNSDSYRVTLEIWLIEENIMSWIKITANGDKPLTKEFGSTQTTVSILAPTTLGGTVKIGYLDETGAFTQLLPTADSDLVAGGQVYVRSGASIPLVANVTGYTADFSIFVSLSRD